MKAKAKREGPLKINLEFDEAIRRALQVKPPPEGWAALERASKQKSKPKHKSAAK